MVGAEVCLGLRRRLVGRLPAQAETVAVFRMGELAVFGPVGVRDEICEAVRAQTDARMVHVDAANDETENAMATIGPALAASRSSTQRWHG